MLKIISNNKNFIAAIFLAAMFFSCGNEIKEIEDFLAEQNLPIGSANNVDLIHTDSGRIATRLIAPVMNDFSNRENHPYTEFPAGIEVRSYDKKEDSVVLTADYAITYSKTNISEVKQNVKVVNYGEKMQLLTNQLFWDASVHYIYTEEPFTLITKTDTIHGVGFESNEDLSKLNMKSISGTMYVNEN